MHATSFDDLVAQCLLSGSKYRLLYVFVRLAALDDAQRQDMGIDDEDAAVVQILFDAHQPAEPGLKFDQVKSVADAHNPDWTLCVVGTATNADASQPSDDQAQAFLSAMRAKVLAGDIDDFMVLDADGMAVMIDADDADEPSDEHDTPPTIN